MASKMEISSISHPLVQLHLFALHTAFVVVRFTVQCFRWGRSLQDIKLLWTSNKTFATAVFYHLKRRQFYHFRTTDDNAYYVGMVNGQLEIKIFNKEHISTRLFKQLVSYQISTKLCQEIQMLDASDRRDIVNRTNYHQTPLYQAVVKNCLNVIDATTITKDLRFLVEECGADLDKGCIEKCHYRTPLCFAIERSNVEMAGYLIERGASVSGADRDNCPYLVIATSTSNAICKLLLEAGADVNALDNELNTALHHAVTRNQLSTVKLLVEHGADATLKSSNGKNAIQQSLILETREIFEHLINNAQLSIEMKVDSLKIAGCWVFKPTEDFSPTNAYWRRAMDMIDNVQVTHKTAAEEKEDVLRPWTTYFRVTEFQTMAELQALQEVDVVIQNVLIYERIIGPFELLTFRAISMLHYYYDSKGTNKSILDVWQHAVHYTIANRGAHHHDTKVVIIATAIVILTMARNPKTTIDVINFEYAINFFQLFIVQLTTEDIRRLRMDVEIFDTLLKLSKSPSQVLQLEMLVRRAIAIIDNLQGKLLHCGHHFLDTLLHTAIKPSYSLACVSATIYPCIDVVELLLESGHDVNVFNDQGKTPLHMAIERKSWTIVKKLLDSGAHVDIKDSNDVEARHMLTNVIYCDFKPLQHLSLKCLATQVILDHQIPYHDIPLTAKQFVDFHICPQKQQQSGLYTQK